MSVIIDEQGRLSRPNTAMLRSLKEIGERHKDMNPQKDTKVYLREARAGGMFDESQ